ncbi:GNAT family N-acetyltransferase [Halomonas sp. NCCP-2165]|nr:GNAT family N-acetyltransferase [Halomonas sp. NCCP-2165]GKW50666.1 hypothetical protein NCCP2165_28810 [Halomonas sp. NCCP-2165]
MIRKFQAIDIDRVLDIWLAALIEDAKQRCEGLTLTVYQANRPSVEFYRKHGFVIHDEQLDANTGQSEWVMT